MPWSLPQSRQPELMDDPGISPIDHLDALRALARINGVSRTAARLAAKAGVILATGSGATGTALVVDVACGGGDVTLELARRLQRRHGPRIRVVGLDVSARAIERCRRLAAGQRVPPTFAVHDVIADGCPPCDVVVNSLFLHHLDDTTASRILGDMATAARRGVIVSDLVRSRVGLALAVVGTTLLASSRVARVDGPLSVRAARTPREYRRLCTDAGLQRAVIRRTWPERVLIEWRREPGNADR
ncbi:MAG: methyltransferase domain-containing protein [Pirellulales bacterium]